jgi:phage terminase large subunit
MDSIRESVHQLLSDQIARLGLDDFYVTLQSEIRGKNGTEFVFAGLRKQTVSSLKSYEAIDICWIEEASVVSRRSLTILLPTIRKPWSEIWFTLNPDLETDAVYQDFIINPPPGAVVCKVGYQDNNWLSKESRQKIDTLRERDPDTFHHVYEGATRSTVEGAIYKQEIQLAEREGRIRDVPYDPMRPVDTFWDLGFADRVSIWAAQRTPFEIKVLRYFEFDHQAIDFYLQEVQSWGYTLGTCFLPWDGAAKSLGTGKSIEEIMRAKGFKTRCNQQLSVTDGINAVRTLFPTLYFDKRLCADGLSYLRRYQWGPATQLGVPRSGPLHDDACFHPDTKVLTRYGRRRIMELEQEGEVLTPCGWKHYTNLGITQRNAQLVAVTFSDGYTVKCTPEHLFMTASGWKSAESLIPGTLIQSGSIPSRSISGVVSTAYGLARLICARLADRFIGTLGNQLSGRFQQAAIFTTATMTPRTTCFQTLSAYLAESIYLPLGIERTREGQLLRAHEMLPLHGTAQKRVGSGTNVRPSVARRGSLGSVKASLASGARSLLMRLSGLVEEAVSFAANHAKALRIISVSRMLTTSDVCCLHVEDGNWFCLENGAVVHNSHPADALRTMAVGIKEPARKEKPADTRYGTASQSWMS